MQSGRSPPKILVLLLAIPFLIVACLPRPQATRGGGAASLDASPALPQDIPPALREFPPNLLPLTQISARPSEETIWAIAECRCSPKATAEILKTYAVTEGVFTQFLVPRVRETIRGNNALKAVLSLPGALKDVLKNLFANDQALAKQVRESLSTKIVKAGNKELKDDIDFRFDHYLLNGKESKAFAIQDMVARWNLVFSLPNYWKAGEPLAFGHHGLQVLETARSLSEWKYFFALDPNSKGGFYGGLSFDTADPKGTKLLRFDPREEPEAKRTVSGTYSLNIPESITALELVTDINEQWVRSPEAPTIMEQAMLWNAGAQAFTRLRMDRRAKHTEGLYGDSEEFLLPVESHKLPLIFLAGVQGQLQDVFLDKELRAVLNKNNPTEVIGLRLLSRLGRSLHSWISVLADLEKAGLDASQLERLKDVPNRLKDGLRLVILFMLKERHFADLQKQSVADVAEAISLIVDSDQSFLASPHLQGEALDAFHRLFAERVLPAWQGKGDTLSTEDLLWFYTAASAISRYPVETHKVPWLKDFVLTLEGQLGARNEAPWE